MRSDLGRRTRRLFFERLREVAPDFEPSGQGRLPGVTWPVSRREGRLTQWMWFQSHQNADAFTVELAWSMTVDDPLLAPLGGPDDPFEAEGRRVRIGAFWEPAGDFWWHLTEATPWLLERSPEEYVAALARPLSPGLERERPLIEAAVSDAVSRVREHALPYFERVVTWAEGVA